MTSEERHEARYKRRKAKRLEKRERIINSIGTAEEVLTYHDLFKYGDECRKNVMWKQSAQTFKRHLFSRSAINRRRALDDNYKPKRLACFTIKERGKVRAIEAPHIDDRQIQKVITKKVLLPLYSPSMIYDNGASLEGKGLIFSQRYLDQKLREHIKKYGYEGYIIIADFKGFFPNADRDLVKKRHSDIKDDKLRNILDTITDVGSGDKGLPLGIEPSQIEMIAYPTGLDNYMNCQIGLKTGHYMDDYHILVPPERDPKEVLKVFANKASEYKITVSTEKTQIVPIGKAFKFCKIKRVFKDDKIAKKGSRESVVRARRKLKVFARTKMKKEDIYTSAQSSIAYQTQYDNHGTELRLRRLFYSLFGKTMEEFGKEQDEIYMPQEI